MIITRLRGGLGNQLFQYAAGRALAEQHKVPLKLDLYSYRKHPYRTFDLHHFNIDAPEASRVEVHHFTGSNPLTRYLNKRENYFRCPTVFAQPHYHFYEDFDNLPGDLYLSGYWQSEKYFASLGTLIRQHFTPRVPLDSRNVELKSEVGTKDSVAVHVRRGDYGSAAYSGFFGGLSDSYYRDAMASIQSQVPNASFYFFSDDIDWCRSTFGSEGIHYVSHNNGDNAYKDLLLMAACRHNIIANSSFSWWGAWLNTSPGKRVIAPVKWFKTNFLNKKVPVYPSRYYNTRDLIPAGWTTL